MQVPPLQPPSHNCLIHKMGEKPLGRRHGKIGRARNFEALKHLALIEVTQTSSAIAVARSTVIYSQALQSVPDKKKYSVTFPICKNPFCRVEDQSSTNTEQRLTCCVISFCSVFLFTSMGSSPTTGQHEYAPQVDRHCMH